MRVTLNGIKRRGLVDWKAREKWLGRHVFIYSSEHHAYWRSNGNGYVCDIEGAGHYLFEDAWDRTKHCGPEKRIEFHTI